MNKHGCCRRVGAWSRAGLFVGLPGEIDGMVHLSDIDWSKPGDEAINDHKKGDTVEVKILDVDLEKERISLGIKQLSGDPFESGAEGLKRGEVVTCTVSMVTDNGIEVTTTSGMTGFIRRSDLGRDRSEQRPDRFAVGEKVDAKISQIDRTSRRLTLSIKSKEIAEEKAAMKAYGSSSSGASLGDILGAALRERQEREGGEEADTDEADTDAADSEEAAASEASAGDGAEEKDSDT